MKKKINNQKKSIYIPSLPSFTRRIGAYILDFILMITLACGIALLLSFIFKYDETRNFVESKYIEYGLKVYDNETQKYVVVSDENVYNAAAIAFNKDVEASAAWSLMFKKTIYTRNIICTKK